MPAVVNLDKCHGSGTFEETCPIEAITLIEIAHIDEDECVDCESFVDECPNYMLSLE